jgi:hypothetical protein
VRSLWAAGIYARFDHSRAEKGQAQMPNPDKKLPEFGDDQTDLESQT